MATTMKGPAAAAKARTRVAVQYREELPSRLQRAIDADSGVLPVDRLFGARDKGRRAVCSLLPELPGGKEGTAQQAVRTATPRPTHPHGLSPCVPAPAGSVHAHLRMICMFMHTTRTHARVQYM